MADFGKNEARGTSTQRPFIMLQLPQGHCPQGFLEPDDLVGSVPCLGSGQLGW